VSSRRGAVGSLSARDAVDFETPAARATSSRRTRGMRGASHARLTACNRFPTIVLRGCPVIVLHDERVLVRLDPRTGRQLLGRAPFASAEPLAGPLEEPVWTSGYRGGWQVLLPNAGNVCE